ncbi:MAG: hypothetical protein GXY53_00625 [Desulfobulbus sp.]|nr:hypothetical protein [Desulfobulbus sp.]
MAGRTKTITVKDGRIRTTCERCLRKQYVVIPAGLRKKMVRCTCGNSTFYTLNHRTSSREATCGKAYIILQNGRECPVYLSDISIGGIGFTVPAQYSRTIAKARDLRIKYRSISGSMVLRRIHVKSMNKNRAGAMFTDIKMLSF